MRFFALICFCLIQFVLKSQSIEWFYGLNVSAKLTGEVVHLYKGVNKEIILTGELEDSSGVYHTAALDSTGTVIWKTEVDPGWYGTRTIKGGNGYYTVIAEKNSTLTDGNVGVIKIGHSGNTIWTKILPNQGRDFDRSVYFSDSQHALFLVAHTGFYFDGVNVDPGKHEIIKFEENTGNVLQEIRLFSWNPLTTETLAPGLHFTVLNDSLVYCFGDASNNFSIFGQLITDDSNPFIVLLDYKNEIVLSKVVLDGPNGDCYQLAISEDQLMAHCFFNESQSDTNTIDIGDTSLISHSNSTYFTSVFTKNLTHLHSRVQSTEDRRITGTIAFQGNHFLGYGVADLDYPLDSTITSPDAIIVRQDLRLAGHLNQMVAGTKFDDRVVQVIPWNENVYLVLAQAMHTLASPTILDTLFVGNQSVLVNNRDYVLTWLTLENPLGVSRIMPSQWINVYPNPASSFITLSIPGIKEINFMRIYGLDGRVQQEWANFLTNEKLNISHLAKGIYLIDIRTGTNRYHTKLVVL